MLILASVWVNLMAAAFVLVCLLMMLAILIQKPKGGGLSGAFGGAGGAVNTAFGSKVGDILTWFTIGCFLAFLLLAMGLTWKIGSEQSAPAIAPIVQPTNNTPTPGPTPEAPPSGTPAAPGSSTPGPSTPQPR